jgi:hypothetical protein
VTAVNRRTRCIVAWALVKERTYDTMQPVVDQVFEHLPHTQPINLEANTDPATLDPIPGDNPTNDLTNGNPAAPVVDDALPNAIPRSLDPLAEFFVEKSRVRTDQIREGLPREYRRFKANGEVKKPSRTIVSSEEEIDGVGSHFGDATSAPAGGEPKAWGSLDPTNGFKRPNAFVGDPVDPDVIGWSTEVPVPDSFQQPQLRDNDAEVKIISKLVVKIKGSLANGG